MSTTPVVTNISESKTWIQKHAWFLIGIVFLGIVVFLGHQWIQSHYNAAVKVSTQAAQVLATQTQVNQSLQQKLDAQEKATQALTAQLTQQNATLVQQAAEAQTKLAQQQAADAMLSNEQLVDRLNTLTGQQIAVNSNGGADLTQKQTTVVTQDVESIPVLKQQLSDETTLAGNQTEQISSLTSLIGNGTIEIQGLTKEITDEKNSCSAEIKTLKKAGLKSKLHWFFAGVGTGVALT